MKVTSLLPLLSTLALQPAGGPAEPVPGASIRGSPESMEEQHAVAVQHRLPFFETAEEIRRSLQEGHLVELQGDDNYEVADFVDPPYILPVGRLFVERTAALYREACGEPLVVTSAVRALEDQPPNAHRLSVHPAGMAVDLRVSPVAECREWLENKLLALEQRGILNGIREFHPPHYHVAIYPTAYAEYVQVQRSEGAVVDEPVDPRRPALGFLGVLALLGVVLLALLLNRRRLNR